MRTNYAEICLLSKEVYLVQIIGYKEELRD